MSADCITFCDASLEAFGLLSKEVGRVMSILVQTRRQDWLFQSSRRRLGELSVVSQWSRVRYWASSTEALQRTIQAGQTRQQFAGLQRKPPPNRPRGAAATSRACLPPVPRGPPGAQGEYGKELPCTISDHNLHWYSVEHCDYDCMSVPSSCGRHPAPNFFNSKRAVCCPLSCFCISWAN